MYAASGPGRLTYDELYSKLSQTKGHVDSKVLSHMIRFFAAEILLANQDILSDLYDAAKASPLSSTKASLREDEGLIFNGAFVAGTPSRCATLYLVLTPVLSPHPHPSHSGLRSQCVHIASTLRSSAVRMLCVCQIIHALPLLVYACRAVLLIAFENGAMPVLCKFTAEQQAVVHEFEVLELLWQEPAVPRIVGPVKLLKANPAGRSHGHVAAPGGQSTVYRRTLACQ